MLNKNVFENLKNLKVTGKVTEEGTYVLKLKDVRTIEKNGNTFVIFNCRTAEDNSADIFVNIQYIDNMFGVIFSQWKVKTLGEFLTKWEKEPITMSLSKNDAGFDQWTVLYGAVEDEAEETVDVDLI